MYQRNYDIDGRVNSVTGELFFFVYMENIDAVTSVIDKGDTAYYRVFFPNPPDCEVKLYIRPDSNTLFDVFKEDTWINFIQTASHDNFKSGHFRSDILLVLKDTNNDSIYRKNHEFFYKVEEWSTE